MRQPITDDLQYVTVRIEVDLIGGRKATGTGYFMKLCVKDDNSYAPVIVTNKHVIRNATRGRFIVIYTDEDGKPDFHNPERIELNNFENIFIKHPEDDVDLAILPIGPLVHEAKQRGKNLFYRLLDISLIPDDDFTTRLNAVEEVLMIGYPNGLWDSINNQPIIRKGITATHPAKDYNGRKEFVIDAACFPGSSGSPVVLYSVDYYHGRTITTFKLLGTLWGGPQHTAKGNIVVVDAEVKNVPLAMSKIPNNLGYVIKSEKLLDFESML